MSRVRPCPQCGAMTSQAMSFCTACGTMLEAQAVADARPTGKLVKPGIAALLVVATLGIYQYVFWWRTSREVDAYAATPGRANTPVRIGILLTIVGTLVTLGVNMALAFPAALAAMEPGAPPADEAAITAQTTRHPAFIGGVATSLAGTAFLYAGMMRAWLAVRAEQMRANRPGVLNPMLLLGVLLAGVALQAIGYFSGLGAVGLLNIVGVILVVYMTQKHLNAMWVTSAPPPPAPSPG